jgi:hypothetical protein
MAKITIGTRVRSYDFPSRSDCFVEGIVTDIQSSNYEVLVDRYVFGGVSKDTIVGRTVYPPLNGLEGMFGVTKGVVPL